MPVNADNALTLADAEYARRTRWFREARFGIFAHWGLYSVLGRGEWVMFNERIPLTRYTALARRFRPAPDFATRWAEQAIAAGARYMVLTTRHHDSFCLFDSTTTEFTAPRLIGRDLVGEYVTAARAAGLRVGLYYSLFNWGIPGGMEPRRNPEALAAMVDQAHAQMRELMTQYGRIDLLWYDGPSWYGWDQEGITDAAKFWRATELNAMVRQLQPEILINNRSGTPEDFDTAEGSVAPPRGGRAWEACMTIGDWQGWGYMRHNPNRKPLAQLLQSLILAANWEGNLLLNVGPKADGSICPQERRTLQEIGNWLRANGEAIYGSQGCAMGAWPNGDWHLGMWTRRDNTAYFHVCRWPGRELVLPVVGSRPRRVNLLATGAELHFTYDDASGRLVIAPLPARPPHPAVSVIKFEFERLPEQKQVADHAAWTSHEH